MNFNLSIKLNTYYLAFILLFQHSSRTGCRSEFQFINKVGYYLAFIPLFQHSSRTGSEFQFIDGRELIQYFSLLSSAVDETAETTPGCDLFMSRLAGVLPDKDIAYISDKQKYMLVL